MRQVDNLKDKGIAVIVPDKKTEAFLNRPATAGSVARLCHDGILPSVDYLRAAALFRNDEKWRRLCRRAAAVLGELSLIAGLLLFCLNHSAFFTTTKALYVLFAVFAACGCANGIRPQTAGSVVLGASVFLTDFVFATGTPLCAELFLWASLQILWDARVKRFYPSFGVLNAAFAACAVQAPAAVSVLFFIGWIAADAALIFIHCLCVKRGKK